MSSSKPSSSLSPPPFPTTLSEISLPTQTNFYTHLSSLRKSTLSIPNRLLSILHDASYIQTLHDTYFPSFPLIANERCGSWYISPEQKRGSAYFKSTDGHVGQWAFSLRRLNIDVLDFLGRFGGAVLVDSTRRGKRLPDALRRTVPVWVGVWNRVLFEREEERGRREGWWDVRGQGMEEGEVALIEERVGGWVEGLKGLGLDLEGIKARVGRPIRCFWVVNGEEVGDWQSMNGNGQWNTLVLCSASRRVVGAEMSEDGYIQGAGDDSESWACGLTPGLFWQHKDQLLSTPEEDLPDLIARLRTEENIGMETQQSVMILPTKNIFLGAGRIDREDQIPQGYDAVVSCNGTVAANPATSKSFLQLGCRSGKMGSRDLREKMIFAKELLSQKFNMNKESRILISCETGKDLSVGVIVMILCMYFDEEGNVRSPVTPNHAIDKQLVKQRLAWITSCKSDANPSRSTLQAVNSFIMERPT